MICKAEDEFTTSRRNEWSLRFFLNKLIYVNKFCVHPKVEALHRESCSQKEEDLFFFSSYLTGLILDLL